MGRQADRGGILIVDDDEDVLLAAELVLKREFGPIVGASDPSRVPALLAEGTFDVVLLDMNFSAGMTEGDEGIRWLKKVLELSPHTKVILMTAYGGVETAVKAIKEGAADFIVKPWENQKLVATVNAALGFARAARAVTVLESKQRALHRQLGGAGAELIGASPAMARVLREVERVAPADAAVLILGENGTGKGLVARAIHNASPRVEQAFVHVDLGAIAEPLFESELFGHRKGAFTDAKEDRPGRFEIASGGTLFLDEIGNLSLQMQRKLLGVLESRTVTRAGSNSAVDVDVRIVCATNMPPEEMRDKLQFRQDLLYRVNTVEIQVPPLRERREDIPLLVEHYVERFARKYNKGRMQVPGATMRALMGSEWPGNVRELVHAVERAVIMAADRTLRLDDLLLRRPVLEESLAELNLEALEKNAIRRAISKHGGNMSKAAEELGLGRTTLYRKLTKHGI
ncbi:MAG TPA: sigma-54 dependent transcriptional regulator [Gammaproteobacteria bacterium]|nr:sigma-54 dependent transcriptional regulator [Gammaproteobacteria bacterium]